MELRATYTFEELKEIVARIRKECSWDSVQTHQSLNTCLMNEAEEVLEGVSLLETTQDPSNLCEELGDLLFLILLHSAIAEEKGEFTLDDVISEIAFKMKFRHPKIFSPEDKEAVSMSWSELKQKEHQIKRKLSESRDFPKYR